MVEKTTTDFSIYIFINRNLEKKVRYDISTYICFSSKKLVGIFSHSVHEAFIILSVNFIFKSITKVVLLDA